MNSASFERVEAAAAELASGGLVAFPTETVWGLGADSASKESMERLRSWKRRGDQPISVIVATPDDLSDLPLRADGRARALARAFWPGPLTLVLPPDPSSGANGFAPGIARDDGAVGVRCSPHPLARELARRARSAGCGFPTATSCNRAGDPAAETADEARRICEARDPGEPRPLLLEPGAGEDAWGEGVPSTVLDLCGETPRVLREGAIAESRIEALLQGGVAEPPAP